MYVCVCMYILFWLCVCGRRASTVGGDCQNMMQLDAARYVVF